MQKVTYRAHKMSTEFSFNSQPRIAEATKQQAQQNV